MGRRQTPEWSRRSNGGGGQERTTRCRRVLMVLAEARCSCPVNVEGRKQRPSEVKFGVLGKSVLAKRQALSASTDPVTRTITTMADSREVHSVR